MKIEITWDVPDEHCGGLSSEQVCEEVWRLVRAEQLKADVPGDVSVHVLGPQDAIVMDIAGGEPI